MRASWSQTIRGLADGGDAGRLFGLMALFFLVVCAVGILRPIKNSLALDGLGATDFYKVYLVSAVVVMFVPVFNRLAGVLAWRTLFGVVAFFFATNLVLFRVLYQEGSAAYGLVFYGWYDLFAAALVTQFFMATQFYFDARSARRAYPLVIAGGSIGATLGGAITGFFAQSVGTPNLLLVAAALIAVFALCIPWVLAADAGGTIAPQASPAGGPAHRSASAGSDERTAPTERGGLAELFADRHVRLIAGTVLLTILVKQLVDYQFNAITRDVFETRDAVSAFQGKFNAATQWLPLVVLAALRPALRRWGMGAALLLLPAFMLLGTVALAVTFGLVAAVLAKGAETSLRYSAERAGREILYVPLPDRIKLQAKAYIDVAVEKGVGKVASALLIMFLLQFMGYRQMAWVSAALALVWFAVALAVRREYVRTLARSIEGRFASLSGVFASLLDASTLPAVRLALQHPAPLRAAFGMELIDNMPAAELRSLAPELNALLKREQPALRAAALGLLTRVPEALDADTAHALLADDEPAVREAAVRALLAHSGAGAPALLARLLRHESTGVRTAALTCVPGTVRTHASRTAVTHADAASDVNADRMTDADADRMSDADADRLLEPFLDDADPRVRASALRCAGLLGRVDLIPVMVDALATPATRDAAQQALVSLGPLAVQPLADALLDAHTPPRIRRALPRTLGRIPAQQTADALLRLVLAPETDQVLDYRALKALSKLRANHEHLVFDAGLVMEVAAREADAAAAYRRVVLSHHSNGDRVATLLHAALEDGFEQRREGVFRCLGMLHPPAAVRRAYTAITAGSGTRSVTLPRANALEWIEHTIGGASFRRLSAVLETAGTPLEPAQPHTLVADGDAWIAHLAQAVTHPSEKTMELIEKVLLLQQVDLLRDARGAHVALLGTIAEEIDVARDTVLIPAGEPPDAMYVVVRGSVELSGVGQSLHIEPEGAFGTWALIDGQPSPVEARAAEQSVLLRVKRDDFHDLLADHSELAVGLLQGLARRMRSLVA